MYLNFKLKPSAFSLFISHLSVLKLLTTELLRSLKVRREWITRRFTPRPTGRTKVRSKLLAAI